MTEIELQYQNINVKSINVNKKVIKRIKDYSKDTYASIYRNTGFIPIQYIEYEDEVLQEYN